MFKLRKWKIMFYLIAILMKIYKRFAWILLIWVVVSLPCFLDASWTDDACVDYKLDEKWCNIVSENYKTPYCVWDDVNYAKSCMWPALTNNLSKAKDTEFSNRQLIEDYCSSMYGGSDVWRIYFAKPAGKSGNRDWQQTFDSHQSLFLHALCSSFKEKNWNMPFINWSDLLWSVYKWNLVQLLNLQQMSDWKDLCSLADNNSLNGCDLSIYMAKIFEWIMSDLFKIKYAQVLHIDVSDNFDKREKVLSFLKWYYLLSGEYQELKNDYSKTISILEDDQEYFRSALSSLKIIDNSKLANLAKNSGCPIEWNIIWMDFVACALHSSQWNGFSLTPAFVTLVYDEVLHYRQFIQYYKYRLELLNKEDLVKKAEFLDFQSYANIQLEAFKEVQNDFEEFNTTYPLHIWMLLYTEKAEKFRNDSLSKIITFFYSLSEKLQNVQEPTY